MYGPIQIRILKTLLIYLNFISFVVIVCLFNTSPTIIYLSVPVSDSYFYFLTLLVAVVMCSCFLSWLHFITS